MMPGGKPVTALPGLTPRSPPRTVGPVLVTVEPASTENDAAVPSEVKASLAADPRVRGESGLLQPYATSIATTKGSNRIGRDIGTCLAWSFRRAVCCTAHTAR